MPTLNDKKKKFKFPSSTLMLFSIIVIIAILTYIVPAGQYAYVDQGGTQVVDGSSFQYVEQNPVNPFRVFVAIQEGFLNGAQIIFLILFGYFWVYSVMQTGAFTAMINRLLGSKARDSKTVYPDCNAGILTGRIYIWRVRNCLRFNSNLCRLGNCFRL